MKKLTGDIIILHTCTKNHNYMMYPTLSSHIIILQIYTINVNIIILHMCTIYDNHMMYGSWDIEDNGQIFFILDHFLPFYPPNNPKNQNFEKQKIVSGNIIILHKCTKNHDHILYCSWDMACDRYNCYHSFILGYFLRFYPPNNPKKWKFHKNERNAWRYHHFTQVYQKLWSYGIPFLRWRVTDVIVIFHFGLFFALLRPEKRKRKFQKKEKKTPGGIIILHKCTKNDDHMLYYSCDMTHDRYNCFCFCFHFGLFFSHLPP